MRRRDFFAAIGGLALCPACAALADESGAFWNYQPKAPEHGPPHWAGSCGSGLQQSPVEVWKDSVYAGLPALTINAPVRKGVIRDNGHTIQLDVEAGNTLTVGSGSYAMTQYHFHSPSEHLTDGVAHSMEVHFVHRKLNGGPRDLGVIGVFLDMVPATGTDTLTGIMRRITASGGQPVPFADIDPMTLIPPGPGYEYSSYPGSLTTPDCDPIVDWFVMRRPVRVLIEGYALFDSLYAQSARPVQPLNGRTVSRNWRS